MYTLRNALSSISALSVIGVVLLIAGVVLITTSAPVQLAILAFVVGGVFLLVWFLMNRD